MTGSERHLPGLRRDPRRAVLRLGFAGVAIPCEEVTEAFGSEKGGVMKAG